MKLVTIYPDFIIYVPNVFTPNGDGLNDGFYAVTRGVKKFSFMIFDRWGALLFSTGDPQQAWDGTYKGSACKQDEYAWKIIVSGINGEERHIAGQVLLAR